MNDALSRWTAGIGIAMAALGAAPHAKPRQAASGAPRGVGALVQPWPDAQGLAARRRAAEERPLFAAETPLEFTLAADFKAVNRDRNPKSSRTFPATLTVRGPQGAPTDILVQIRTRGHVRRLQQTCSFCAAQN